MCRGHGSFDRVVGAWIANQTNALRWYRFAVGFLAAAVRIGEEVGGDALGSRLVVSLVIEMRRELVGVEVHLGR